MKTPVNREPGRRRILVLLAVLMLSGVVPRGVQASVGDVVIAVYQGPCEEGRFSENLDVVRRVTREAVGEGSHFVVFPECFLSGYDGAEAVAAGARGLDDGELVDFIAETADHEAVVLVGLARKDGPDLYNSQLVIHRGQLLGMYDKVMLTHADRHELGYRAGEAVPVFFAHGLRFGIAICHDTSFPHVAMMARKQGAEVLFTPHNNLIVSEAAEDHRRWVRNCHVGLATQLKMVVARSNIVRDEDEQDGRIGYGDSFILSPQGTPLAEAEPLREGLITATITPAMFLPPWVWADLAETPAWLGDQLGQMLTEFRTPATDEELFEWLAIMAEHQFTPREIGAATGLTLDEVQDASRRLAALDPPASVPGRGDLLRVLPWPGGRHPRLGFLEGAVMPQRETKFSVFPPWEGGGFVVADVPEAIFSNLGLTYLAHTHIPTLWDELGVRLPRQEWRRLPGGVLESERTLPNGIRFGARIVPQAEHVQMSLWLHNGTDEPLTGLRVQNCVMLGHAAGFEQQDSRNKAFEPPYAAARAADSARWVITAWDPIQRSWGNERCPCLHADPIFPDCPPGATVSARGWLSFFEGEDIRAEFRRIEETGWRADSPPES